MSGRQAGHLRYEVLGRLGLLGPSRAAMGPRHSARRARRAACRCIGCAIRRGFEEGQRRRDLVAVAERLVAQTGGPLPAVLLVPPRHPD